MKVTLNLNSPMWNSQARRAKLDQVVQESGAELEANIKAKMLPSTRKKPPTGRVYRKGSIKKAATKPLLKLGLKKVKGSTDRVVAGSLIHRASAPGEAPAVETGGLVNSVRSKKNGDLKNTVSVGKRYGEALENGARPPSKRSGRISKKRPGPVRNLMGPHRGGIQPRPFFGVTVEEFRPKFKENVETAISSLTKAE